MGNNAYVSENGMRRTWGGLRGPSFFFVPGWGHDSKSCKGVSFVKSILVFPWSPYQGAEGPRLSRECVVGCVVGNG